MEETRDGTSSVCCLLFGCDEASREHGFVSVAPVDESGCGEFEMRVDRVEEEISIFCKEFVAIVVESADFDLYFLSVGLISSGGVSAVDEFVVGFPESLELCPHFGDDVSGPEHTGVVFVFLFGPDEEVFLESAPFYANPTVEELSPADCILFSDKTATCWGTLVWVYFLMVVPGFKTIEQDAEEHWISDESVSAALSELL